MDEAQARRRGEAAVSGSRPARPSSSISAPGVGLVVAGEHLDQRRLAGAVLADQRVDLARAQVEVDAVEGPGAGERLGQPADAQDRAGGLDAVRDRMRGRHFRPPTPSRPSMRRSLRTRAGWRCATAMISETPWKTGWLQTDADARRQHEPLDAERQREVGDQRAPDVRTLRELRGAEEHGGDRGEQVARADARREQRRSASRR